MLNNLNIAFQKVTGTNFESLSINYNSEIMKTKILTFICLLTTITSVSFAQSREHEKELKKEAKKVKIQEDYMRTGHLLDSMRFVLEANYLNNQRGNRVFVPSTLNFIKIDSTKAIIQIGSNTGMGYNGVGGVTAEGSISRWKLVRNEKHKSFDISFNVMTNIGSYDIFMSVSASGNASATLSGITYGRLEYEGYVVPLKKSRIFKGSNTY